MKNTIIYGKHDCPHTQQALKAYPDAIFHDVVATAGKLDEMLMLSDGVRRVPLILRNGEREIGFQHGS